MGGETSLEFFCRKSDAALFAYGTHSKKRPNNLILGRMFDGHLYDVVPPPPALNTSCPTNLVLFVISNVPPRISQLELGVLDYKSIDSFGAANTQIQLGNKPMFVFAGDKFENEPDFKLAKSLLLDLFRCRNLVDFSRGYLALSRSGEGQARGQQAGGASARQQWGHRVGGGEQRQLHRRRLARDADQGILESFCG